MGKRSTRALLSGATAAARFGAKSYGPSLMPRSAVDQGLVTGGSILVGFVAGATASLALELLPKRFHKSILKTAGITTAGSKAAGSLAAGAATEPERATAAEGWTEAGLDVIGSAAAARVLTSKKSTMAKLAVAGGTGFAAAADATSAVRSRTDEPDAQYLATSLAVALGANGAIAIGLGAIRLGGIAARSTARSRPKRVLLSAFGSAAVLGMGFIGIRSAAAKASAKIAAGNRATEIAFADTPANEFVSGGTRSRIPYESLGLQGRRFVSSASTTDQIAAVTGAEPISSPVRVYVGVESAPSIGERVDAAIAELDQLGGFDRSVLIAACPAGTGYVNYIPIEAAEYMSRGDCATVAIQYGSLPSMMSLNKLGLAADTYKTLVGRLRSEITERGSSTRLMAYGESLGALAGQAGILAASGGEPDEIVDRALWVGTPKGSTLFEQLVSSGTPVMDSPADLDSENRPVALLNHHNDPVTLFAAQDLYEMPSWMEPVDRGRGTNPDQRWLPGISFFQGLIDTKNAATVIPGEFNSTGHDYRADLASFVRYAFGFDNVSDDELERVESALRTSEIERSHAIELGKTQPS